MRQSYSGARTRVRAVTAIYCLAIIITCIKTISGFSSHSNQLSSLPKSKLTPAKLQWNSPSSSKWNHRSISNKLNFSRLSASAGATTSSTLGDEAEPNLLPRLRLRKRDRVKQFVQHVFQRKRQHLYGVMLAFSMFFHTYVGGGPVPAHSHAPNEQRASMSIAATKLVTSSERPSARTASTASASASKANVANLVSRGGARASKLQDNEVSNAVNDLLRFLSGGKSDILILLAATAMIPSICKNVLKISPILGFLSAGMLLGPNMLNLINDKHTVELLGDLGIVFFLFEMGVELSTERLLSMKKDVFGLGLSQFIVTTLVGMGIGSGFLSVPLPIMLVISGGLALSSSAFVLQLLKDKQELGTRHGKAGFGVLLFQDLAVVPLLVITPLLAPNSGTTILQAIRTAALKASMALSAIAVAGRFLLNPLFAFTSLSLQQEAFLSTILLTVLSMSFLTQGLGLSNTLGAFLAGTLLSETKYRYAVEADIAPFRGTLLAIFFLTVGFEIDPSVFLSIGTATNVLGLLGLIIGMKAAVMMILGRFVFKLSLPAAVQSSLLLAQGGEFAFVVYGMAKSLGILSPQASKLLLTSVALSMAVTPALADFGSKLGKRLEESSGFDHYLGQDSEAQEIMSEKDYVVVVGYGTVGKVVTDLLDSKFVKYVGLEVDPNKAIQARNKGLPVFYGDVSRPEVADAFGVGKATAVILTISDPAATNRAVISLRRNHPDLKIFARAKDETHMKRLVKTLNVDARIPTTLQDNFLISLPFGGAVLELLGTSKEEVDTILEEKRREVLMSTGSLAALQQQQKQEDELEAAMEVEVEAASVSEPNQEIDVDGSNGEGEEEVVLS